MMTHSSCRKCLGYDTNSVYKWLVFGNVVSGEARGQVYPSYLQKKKYCRFDRPFCFMYSVYLYTFVDFVSHQVFGKCFLPGFLLNIKYIEKIAAKISPDWVIHLRLVVLWEVITQSWPNINDCSTNSPFNSLAPNLCGRNCRSVVSEPKFRIKFKLFSGECQIIHLVIQHWFITRANLTRIYVTIWGH